MIRNGMFLALPLVTTLTNLLFALFLIQYARAQEIPALQETGDLDLCAAGLDANGVCSSAPLLDAVIPSATCGSSDSNEEEEEEDPQLFQMPEDDFKAYVRADVATFYGEAPGSRTESTPVFPGQASKFINLSPDRMALYWDAGMGPPGQFISNIGPWESGGTATFPGHKFFLASPHNPNNEARCSFSITRGTSVYYCDPYEAKGDDGSTDPARGLLLEERQDLKTLTDEQLEKYKDLRFNLEFGARYKEFTGGQEWLSQYPRNPPRHKIWRADYYGQEHQVKTQETQFLRVPEVGELNRMTLRRNATDDLPFAAYRQPDSTLNLTIKALSCSPRIFEIKNFLSEVEVDHLLSLVTAKQLQRSTTGSSAGKLSDVRNVRTSRNTWLGRHKSPVVDAIYRRAADALRIDESWLRMRQPDEHPEFPTNMPISEDIQIVHYDRGQEYTAHHDFGLPDGRPDSPSRSINICFYLNEGMTGGETAFPRWRNAHTSDAIKVTPEKGKAVIFYMLTPDGNMDDLSQHAALPVIEGEKWFANLWIWDPVRY